MNSDMESSPVRSAVLTYVREQVLTFANALTLLRVVVSVLMIWVVMDPRPFMVAWYVNVYHSLLWLALVGWVTDGLDGFFARRLDQRTILGRVFDQWADKMFGIALMFAIVCEDGWTRYNAPILVAICIYTGIVATLRYLKLTSVSSRVAKWKTFIQFGAGVLVLAANAYEWPHANTAAYWILWISLIPMGYACYGYCREAKIRLRWW